MGKTYPLEPWEERFGKPTISDAFLKLAKQKIIPSDYEIEKLTNIFTNIIKKEDNWAKEVTVLECDDIKIVYKRRGSKGYKYSEGYRYSEGYKYGNFEIFVYNSQLVNVTDSRESIKEMIQLTKFVNVYDRIIAKLIEII